MVGDSFQSINCVHFCVNREEVNSELMFKVPPGLDGENASVCFLTKHIFRPLSSVTTFEECEGPENSLLFVVELLQSQADIEGAEVQECMAVVTFSVEVRGTGELGMCLSYCQRGGGDTRRDGTGGGGVFGLGKGGD